MDDYRYNNAPPKHLTALIFGAVLGALIAGIAYVSFGLVFEHYFMPKLVPAGAPTLSYGQQAGLLAIVAASFGAACGCGTILVLQSRWLLGMLLTIVACAGMGLVAVGSWVDQRTRYGYDPSEWVLFAPLVAEAAVACSIVAVVVLVSAIGGRVRPIYCAELR